MRLRTGVWLVFCSVAVEAAASGSVGSSLSMTPSQWGSGSELVAVPDLGFK